jgi:hypothetical protein
LGLTTNSDVVWTELLAAADFFVRELHIPDIEEDGNYFPRSGHSELHSTLDSSKSIDNIFIFSFHPRHIGDEYDLGSRIFQ